MEEWLVEEIALEVEVDLSLLASVITRWLGRKTGGFQDANCIAHQNFAAVAHTSFALNQAGITFLDGNSHVGLANS